MSLGDVGRISKLKDLKRKKGEGGRTSSMMSLRLSSRPAMLQIVAAALACRSKLVVRASMFAPLPSEEGTTLEVYLKAEARIWP